MKHMFVALTLIVLVFITSFALPFAGLIDTVWQRVKPCTLAEQIQAANTDRPVRNCPAGSGHDTIELTHDIVLTERLPVIDSRITIRGNGHTISGSGKYDVFVVYKGNLTLEDLHLIDTYTVSGGSAVYVYISGAVNIKNCSITNGFSHDQGAVAANTYGFGPIYIRIDDSIFAQNSGRSRALHNRGANVTIKNTEFNDNAGGAIYNVGEMTISGSTFRENSKPKGGAIYNNRHFRGLPLTIVDSEFISNTAETGGAIYNKGTMDLENVRFVENAASHHGGDMYSRRGGAIENRGELKIVGSIFLKNKAPMGGAVYSKREFSRIDPRRDTAETNEREYSLSIQGSTFSQNSARDGGGLYVEDGRLDIDTSILKGNRALVGGGLYVDRSVVSISASAIHGNRAQLGGGIYRRGGAVKLFETDVASNSGGNIEVRRSPGAEGQR